MKKAAKITKAVLLGIVSVLLVAAIVVNIYLPRYWMGSAQLDAADIQRSGDEFAVMSYNIRCWTFMDLGKKSWPYRAELVLDTIASHAPDVIGLQEVTSGQYSFFKKALVHYESVIQYRDNSPLSEGCPIFYNALRYQLEESGSFWLSQTPDVMSKDWGAAHYRICSYVVLADRESGGRMVVFNTHLDHVSDEARIKGIGVVLDKIGDLGGLPAIVMGDLNAPESADTYRALTENFEDTKYLADTTMQSNTYHNWGAEMGASPIDYIMLSRGDFEAYSYAVDTRSYNGVYPSDHFPVCAVLRFSA